MPFAIMLALALVTSTAAIAQYPDPEVKSMRDMLKPNAECRGQQTTACKAQARRACRLEIDGTNVPCELVWYIEFKDGSHAVQFNKGTGNKPMISFSGTEGDVDTIKVDTVMLRGGDHSVATDESEATGSLPHQQGSDGVPSAHARRARNRWQHLRREALAEKRVSKRKGKPDH